jgi:hypothetical protein
MIKKVIISIYLLNDFKIDVVFKNRAINKPIK